MSGRTRLSRRSFMQRSAAVAAGAAMTGWSGSVAGRVAMAGSVWNPVHEDIQEATIADLQARMTDGSLDAQHLTGMYLARIAQLDQDGPRLNSVIMTNPDALRIAIELDRERAAGTVRGPLHGIPILLKDNIDTADAMPNTAGSIALANNYRSQDATIAARLRDAGAIVLGKTNLSEWANFRSTQSSSGWSGVGRQTKNPYVLTHNPCGSSSGSGAAASANFAAAAIGTETDGSIVCPATANGVVGIKPTVGLTSRAGVIPIAHSQDTVGPLARTVADAAAVLSAIAGPDPRDPMTAASAAQVKSDYTAFLDPEALDGARIGVPRTGGMWGYSPEADGIVEAVTFKTVSRPPPGKPSAAPVPPSPAMRKRRATLPALSRRNDAASSATKLAPEAGEKRAAKSSSTAESADMPARSTAAAVSTVATGCASVPAR